MIQRIGFLLAPCEKGISPHGYTNIPPLSLGILSGYLKNEGYDVELYDLNSDLAKIYRNDEQFAFLYDKDIVLNCLTGEENDKVNLFAEELLQGIPIKDYDVIGISCGADFSFFQLHSAFLLAKYIKQKYKIPVILGGNNITYLGIFKDTFSELLKIILEVFPYIIKGPGEVVIAELIQVLNGKMQKSVYELDGMVYLKDGQVYMNPEHEPVVVCPDWCNLPMEYYYSKIKNPSYNGKWNDKLEEENLIQVFKWPFFLTQYVSTVRKKRPRPEYMNKLILPYIFNFHCPFACAFCSESDEDRKRVIIGEAHKVVDDIEALINKYKTNYFYFFNNAANASGKFIDEFCNYIIDKKIDIKWSDCARFNNLTFERLKLMRDAGCQKLVFGFETASQKLIDLVEKKIDLSHGERVLKWCKELGIIADLEVITGLPQEKDEDFQETVQYVTKNRPYINYMTINEFFVVPNSKIGRYPERYNIELIRNVISYSKILERSWKYFKEMKGKQTGNFKVYKYNEIGGRNYKEVADKTKFYIKALNNLQNKEFAEVEYVYRILEQKS
ncbi:B12-binding domain-containing radical SAM protein [Clostridium sp. BNL1100]|uniref:B12-binding domain-containing radical SAM protein n=1 Tax=Clostridium sp. BNL1100 TaxID=755731 RepID=UPI00024A7407|nr:B12-binding domain-containing radical SAM protein [Clostridium sp. BNL1100]AEY67256.1 Fe-S oxidoreductase [Clostridium sp. BNL1100]